MKGKENPIPARNGVITETNKADNSILTEQSEIVKPAALETAFKALIEDSKNVKHGVVELCIHYRDGRPSRYTITHHESFLLGEGA